MGETVTVDTDAGTEETAEAAEAAAEAAEAVAEAAEAVAEAAEEVAENADSAQSGATDREVAEAERLALLERAHADHESDHDHHIGRDEARTIAESVLWETAGQLEELARAAAAEAVAEEAPEDVETTVVAPDVSAEEIEEANNRTSLLRRIF